MSEQGASSTGRRFGCPGCGGGLRYDIASGQMICDHCGQLTDLSRVEEIIPRENPDVMDVTEFHCPQCGAVVYSTDTSVTGFCSFCGSDVILTSKLGRTRRPAAIVPFSVTREACEAAYREHLSHYHLMPEEFRSAETISHFRPVYVPFWSYHVTSNGAAELKGNKSYTRGNYHYTEEYDLSMHADIDQRGILYDASSAFEDETAAMLQHTADRTVPFHSAYLSGFYAQSADVPAQTYEDEAAATAVRMFMDRVKEEYNMDSVEMAGDIQHAFGLPDARFQESLVMMPVWLLAHRHGQRVVYTAVNGSTGQVVCDVPVSNGKVIGIILALAAGLFALLWTFLTLKPDLLMLLCSVLLLLTQVMFSGAATALNERRTRTWEPDFSGERPTFVGPAQALLKRKGDTIAAKSVTFSKVKGSLWGIPILAAVIFGFAVSFINGESSSSLKRLAYTIQAGSVSLATPAMLLILAVMIGYSAFKAKKGGKGTILPRVVSCVACAAGLLFQLMGRNEDMLYYASAAVMLLAAVWELVIIIRAHNEYASRPVPFFQEEDEA